MSCDAFGQGPLLCGTVNDFIFCAVGVFLLISYSHSLNTAALGLVSIFTICGILFTYFSMLIMNRINVLATEFLAKVSGKYSNKLIRRKVQSCQPIRMNVGNFFYIKSSTILTFLNILANYVITLVLSFSGKY